MKPNIAVIGGGDSAEIEISLLSQQTVLDHLNADKYNIFKVIVKDQYWYVDYEGEKLDVDRDDFSFTVSGSKVKFDFAFIVIHGTPGEDGLMQGYFELIGVPYNTPGHMASTITFNKWACNHLLRSLGLNCAKSVLVSNTENVDVESILGQLELPLFVKPNDGGSSFGVSKVKEKGGVEAAIAEAFRHGSEVIIEETLVGTEVTCGVVRIDGELKVLPVTEIASENEFFDYEAKYQGKSQEITPARLDADVYSAVQKTAGKVYELLGLKGMSRVDFIVVDGVPFVMEINTTPGLSPESIIPQQCREVGISLEQLFDAVIVDSYRF